ncbi:hypothetical protein MKX01_038334 [Papaver californicum]|nr:hypothetical protein MKX01_038334 [Papaver californicum]
MSGMPRPVKELAAAMEILVDCPTKPSWWTTCQWLEHSDPDFDVAQKLKQLLQKHAKEASYLLQIQVRDEE